MTAFLAEPPASTRRAAIQDADYDIDGIAARAGASRRYIERLNAAKAIPGKYKLGRLTRFSRKKVDEWFDAGCPGVRPLRRDRKKATAATAD